MSGRPTRLYDRPRYLSLSGTDCDEQRIQRTLERIYIEDRVLPMQVRIFEPNLNRVQIRLFEPNLDGSALRIIRCNNAIRFVLILIQARKTTNNPSFSTVLSTFSVTAAME